MKKYLRMAFAALLLLAVSSFVVAQDDVIDEDEFFGDVDRIQFVDPDAAIVTDETSDETIEAITDDSEAYYGAIVTIEGQVVTFISPRIFSMGEEEELFTDSFVLVVNNAANAFPDGLVEGANVRITGRVNPSHDEFMDGVDWSYAPYDEEAAADTTQQEAERMNMVSFAQRGYIPEEFGEHTILEVLNVENVEILSYDDLLAID